MSQDVYQKLAQHLDQMPSGYPPTEDGVELRILSQLFTPEEAELATHLKMKLEPAPVIAQRAGLNEEEAAIALERMARKGLIFSIEAPGRPPVYMASQFVIGIWEYNLNNLTPQFVADVEAYMPKLAETAFGAYPQLRTIPVGKSLPAAAQVLPYESAEEIIRKQQTILVAPCVCRKEAQVQGHGCDKPMETCLVFGWGADYYRRNGLGRMISQDEALDILKRAEEEALVVQPSNAQDAVNICLCCGDCCQSLMHLKRLPAPAKAVFSPFLVTQDEDACIGCGLCVDRCQMEAFSMDDDKSRINADRCIGCGLCVTACAGEALSLVRKPEQPDIPKSTMEAAAIRAKVRAELQAKLERHKKL